MRTLLIAAALVTLPASALAQNPSAEELTRLLNGAPPAARPAPQPQPVRPSPAPAPATSAAPAAQAPAVVRPAPLPQPQPQSQGARPGSATVPAAPVRATAAAPVAAAPNPAPAPVPSTPAPGALNPAAIAALPFRIDLPTGFQLFEGRGAPDSRVWSVRKAGKTFAMIYAGPSSQFPIYDGERVTAAGRVSVIVPEGARRIAMEHLFQRVAAPAEIHVWLMSLDGADRDAAERIAQSVDPR